MLQIAKNFSVYTGVRVITGSISFFLLPLLTKYLSPEDYGLLSIFNACIRFLSAFIGLGMTHLLLVDLVKDRKEFTLKLKSFGIVTVIIASILTAVALLYSFFYAEFFGIPSYFILFIPFVALIVVHFEFIISVSVFLKHAKKYAVFSLSKFGSETILTVLLIVGFGMNWVGRVASLVISLLAIMVFLVFYMINEFDLTQKVEKIKYHALKLIKAGSGLFFMAMSLTIINLSDRFFIEHLEGVSETGIYSVAATISSVMLMVVGALISVIRPIIYENFKNKTTSKLKRISLLYHSILLMFAFILILLTPFIFEYLIDPNFKDAEKLTYILLIGLFFWGGYNFFLSYLLYKEKNRINSWIAVFSIVLNLILNYFFIDKYGINGAAYATLVTYFIMFIFSIVFTLPNNKTEIYSN